MVVPNVDLTRLLVWLRTRGGRTTVRQLQRSNSRLFPDAATATAALEALVQAGQAQWMAGQPPRTGGCCPKYVEFCPAAVVTDTRSESDLRCPTFDTRNASPSIGDGCAQDVSSLPGCPRDQAVQEAVVLPGTWDQARADACLASVEAHIAELKSEPGRPGGQKRFLESYGVRARRCHKFQLDKLFELPAELDHFLNKTGWA